MNELELNLLQLLIVRHGGARTIFVHRLTANPELAPGFDDFAGDLAEAARGLFAETIDLETAGVRLPWNARFVEPRTSHHPWISFSRVAISNARTALVYRQFAGEALGGGGMFELYFRGSEDWERLRSLNVWRG